MRSTSPPLLTCALLSLLVACDPQSDPPPPDDTKPSREDPPGSLSIEVESHELTEGEQTLVIVRPERPPLHPVHVSLQPSSYSDHPSAGYVEQDVLVLDPDAGDPAEFTVWADDDLFANGDREYRLDVIVWSEDTGYDGLLMDDIPMRTLDDEVASFELEVLHEVSREDGMIDGLVRVRVATPPIEGITFDVEATPSREATAEPQTITFSPGGSLTRAIALQGRDDLRADGDTPYRVALRPSRSADAAYSALDSQTVDLLSLDGVCGNGVLEASEECDDGNRVDERCDYSLACCTICNAQCLEVSGEVLGQCGDEELQPNHEECDLDEEGEVITHRPDSCDALGRSHGAPACIQSCQRFDLSSCRDHDVTALAVGGAHACQIDDEGAISCWGHLPYEQRPPGMASAATHIAAGGPLTCASFGENVECWGLLDEIEPPEIGGQTLSAQVVSLDVGQTHACAVSSAGQIECWGAGARALLFPPTIAAPEQIVEVAVGAHHACLRTDTGAVECWGAPEAMPTFEDPAPRFEAISAGGDATCGIIQGGAIRCWGASSAPQLAPPTEGVFRSIALGELAACAVDEDNQIFCWGDPLVTQETPDLPLLDVAVGGHGACGRRPEGDLRCWGAGIEARVADPAANDAIEDIAAGARHVCALDRRGDLRCWGEDASGESTPPIEMSAREVAAGDGMTCARYVRQEEEEDSEEVHWLECWGEIEPPPARLRPFSEPPDDQDVLMARGPTACQLQSGPSSQATCWGARGEETFDAQHPWRGFALGPDGETCSLDEQGGYEATAPRKRSTPTRCFSARQLRARPSCPGSPCCLEARVTSRCAWGASASAASPSRRGV